ncbi:hypothetical protein P3S67_013168 [Capsicum chacoense]
MEYSYEEKMLKAYLNPDRQGCVNWEKKNRSWELQNGLVPTVEDWEMEYSFEEKRLKSHLDKDGGYYRWEKQNWLWERENHRVPFEEGEEEEERKQKEVHFLLSSLSLKDPKKEERLLELHRKGLTEEEKKIKESYLEKEENWCLGLSKEHERVPSREEELQKREGRREELAAQGRCLDGNYLTPYCKCDRQCYRFDTTLKDHPQECLPIWLAYCRQYCQSHCFDIDDCIDGICPLGPSHCFGGMSEIMMELASHAIKEYNEKECNVFKYKVLKIEKVNYTVGMYNTYWMTVKVLNLTLGTPIETFQIHAATSCIYNDKVIFCCRPKEEAIVGLPSCEFCFGLLSEVCVTEGKEP